MVLAQFPLSVFLYRDWQNQFRCGDSRFGVFTKVIPLRAAPQLFDIKRLNGKRCYFGQHQSCRLNVLDYMGIVAFILNHVTTRTTGT